MQYQGLIIVAVVLAAIFLFVRLLDKRDAKKAAILAEQQRIKNQEQKLRQEKEEKEQINANRYNLQWLSDHFQVRRIMGTTNLSENDLLAKEYYSQMAERTEMEYLDKHHKSVAMVSKWFYKKRDEGYYFSTKGYARAMAILEGREWLSDEDYNATKDKS